MEQEIFELKDLHVVIFHNERKIKFIREEEILCEFDIDIDLNKTGYLEKVINLKGKDYMFMYKSIPEFGDSDIDLYRYDKINNKIDYNRPYPIKDHWR